MFLHGECGIKRLEASPRLVKNNYNATFKTSVCTISQIAKNFRWHLVPEAVAHVCVTKS